MAGSKPSSNASFGVHLPTRMLTGGESEPPTPELLNQIVDSAKDSGFSSIWVTDHIVFFDPWLDCMLLLASIAGRAKERGMTIATGVIGLPLRHPVAMAQSFATLDILCGGNLIVGVGEGSTKSDFDALGIPFDRRRKMLNESIVALRALLSEQNVTHKGEFYSFENITISPASIQKPGPPIWLSSWGAPAGMRRVAQLSDGWVASALHSTPEEFGAAKELLTGALLKAGKDPDTFPHAVDTMFMYIDEDGDRARAIAGPIIEKSSGTPFDPASGHSMVGNGEECLELLGRWTDAGAKQVCLWPVLDPVGQISKFGEQVISRL